MRGSTDRQPRARGRSRALIGSPGRRRSWAKRCRGSHPPTLEERPPATAMPLPATRLRTGARAGTRERQRRWQSGQRGRWRQRGTGRRELRPVAGGCPQPGVRRRCQEWHLLLRRPSPPAPPEGQGLFGRRGGGRRLDHRPDPATIGSHRGWASTGHSGARPSGTGRVPEVRPAAAGSHFGRAASALAPDYRRGGSARCG